MWASLSDMFMSARTRAVSVMSSSRVLMIWRATEFQPWWGGWAA
jgi:hypothetical protein